MPLAMCSKRQGEIMSRIIVENISKHFKIYRRPQDRLAEILFRKQKHELFRVLNDISFALEDGES